MIKMFPRFKIRTTALLGLCTVIIFCNGCKAKTDSESITNLHSDWEIHRQQLYTDSVLPTVSSLLHNGDMVTRLGNDITSEMLLQMNQTDKSFSHCGIISIENDSIFVYHAIGGEFNPNQKLKRELLSSFGDPSENKGLGLFKPELSAKQLGILLHLVRGLYLAGVPFDMDFDYATTQKLYCAEFVAKSYGIAFGQPNWMTFSQKGNFKYVAVDDLFRNTRMTELGRWVY